MSVCSAQIKLIAMSNVYNGSCPLTSESSLILLFHQILLIGWLTIASLFVHKIILLVEEIGIILPQAQVRTRILIKLAL